MSFEGLVHVAGLGQMRSDKMRLEGEPVSQDQRQGLGNASTPLAAGTANFGKEFGNRKGERPGTNN